MLLTCCSLWFLFVWNKIKEKKYNKNIFILIENYLKNIKNDETIDSNLDTDELLVNYSTLCIKICWLCVLESNCIQLYPLEFITLYQPPVAECLSLFYITILYITTFTKILFTESDYNTFISKYFY